VGIVFHCVALCIVCVCVCVCVLLTAGVIPIAVNKNSKTNKQTSQVAATVPTEVWGVQLSTQSGLSSDTFCICRRPKCRSCEVRLIDLSSGL